MGNRTKWEWKVLRGTSRGNDRTENETNLQSISTNKNSQKRQPPSIIHNREPIYKTTAITPNPKVQMKPGNSLNLSKAGIYLIYKRQFRSLLLIFRLESKGPLPASRTMQIPILSCFRSSCYCKNPST
ncbi:hypothetical protein Tcan_00347 [Toxocara canis]|uniref:Uncharacterized protein n=1 Tax=Toxocara canis TaxID=6265 RepID=A0A0B2UJE9_TOXCA|nr:hypothetical protein Tcan_00347 [Toxocara canis]